MIKLFEEVTDEQKLKILANFERTPETLKNDINAIKIWLEKQPHLPEVPSDFFIENFLKLSKFSIEMAKKRIDAFYTMRSKLPEILHMTSMNSNPSALSNYADMNYAIPLPKLTKDLCRIVIYKLAVRDPDAFDLSWSVIWGFHVNTIRMLEECTVDNLLIWDFENVTFNYLIKFDVAKFKSFVEINKKIFKRPIKSIHYVNCPGIMDSVLKIVKAVISPKLADRIIIHKSLETLYDKVPKQLLPSDYGGAEESLKMLNEKLKGKFVEYKTYFDRLDTLKVNENLRPEKLVDDELLGSYGNFRKLNVD